MYVKENQRSMAVKAPLLDVSPIVKHALVKQRDIPQYTTLFSVNFALGAET